MKNNIVYARIRPLVHKEWDVEEVIKSGSDNVKKNLSINFFNKDNPFVRWLKRVHLEI